MFSITTKLLINSLFLSLLFSISLCQLNQNTIRLVYNDQMHNLFGGGSVVNSSGFFQYQELRATLDRLAGGKQHRIYSISLLDSIMPGPTKQMYVQYNFYNQNYGRPNQATINRVATFYYRQGVCGSWINPSYIPSFLLKKFLLIYKLFKYDNLQKIFELINAEFTYNVYSNIYVHSYDGLDEVSYVLGAYKLKYRNASLADVVKEILQFHKKNGKNTFDSAFYNGLRLICLEIGRSSEQCLLGKDVTSADQTL